MTAAPEQVPLPLVQQLALVEGWKSVNTDPANFSAHRFLADSYAALPRHEIARVSELLQSTHHSSAFESVTPSNASVPRVCVMHARSRCKRRRRSYNFV